MRLRREILSRLHRHVLDRSFDRRFGLHTNGVHQPETLGLRGENAALAIEYEATPTLVFRRMLAVLPVDLSRFVFIDLGSGKGRALLMAASLPFCRIEGVELSTEMHRLALQNIASLGERGAAIRSHNVDAVAYEFPPEPFVLYLFNPFREEVLVRVRANLERSLQQTPREGYVLYVNARHRTVFDSARMLTEMPRSGRSRLIDQAVSPWPLAFYATVVAG